MQVLLNSLGLNFDSSGMMNINRHQQMKEMMTKYQQMRTENGPGVITVRYIEA